MAHAFGVDESGTRMRTLGAQFVPSVLVVALIAHTLRVHLRVCVPALGYLLLFGEDFFGCDWSCWWWLLFILTCIFLV